MTKQANYTEIVENFKKVISLHSPLEEHILLEIVSQFQVQNLPKKTIVINHEQPYERIYFIHIGLLRGYYFDDEKEISNWFAKNNDFVFSPTGFSAKQLSDETIETIEDTILLSIRLEDLEKLYITFPEVSKISRIFTEHYLSRYDKKIRLLRIQNSEKRVKTFIKEYPKEFQQLPYKYIASFLGLAPETFSRIISRKN